MQEINNVITDCNNGHLHIFIKYNYFCPTNQQHCCTPVLKKSREKRLENTKNYHMHYLSLELNFTI